ncbi:MAG TPA: S-layer homology domain-containing protein [Pseudoneobacillus sp.]|nr:S-layer homology domain-containing protein [Pseudoneobacillus sp.]
MFVLIKKSTNINGIAEPGSVISVNSNGIEIASTVTFSDGTFLVAMDPHIAGTMLEITAKDASGNISNSNRIFIEKRSTNSFGDLISTHRFYNEINYLLTREIITGFPNGSFRPNDKVTRAQAAIMIGRALGLNGGQGETGFKDVGTSSSASGFIKAAVERGIIKGFPDNTYRPNEPVTRGQMGFLLQEHLIL